MWDINSQSFLFYLTILTFSLDSEITSHNSVFLDYVQIMLDTISVYLLLFPPVVPCLIISLQSTSHGKQIFKTNIQNIIFCVLQRKVGHTGLEWHEGWVNEDFSIPTNSTKPSRKTMLVDPPVCPTPNQRKLAWSFHVSVNNTEDQTTLEDEKKRQKHWNIEVLQVWNYKGEKMMHYYIINQGPRLHEI